MQGRMYEQNMPLPYSKWSQHRANNGLIYLSHPVTGEVKWLWSRHHDPKTSNDYLVNTVTGDRQWVTKQNEHLCPATPHSGESSSDQAAKSQRTIKPRNRTAAASKDAGKPRVHAKPANAKYLEIAAPKSLGLTADEVLMLVPETGRRYIYNKKTKTSRWLSDCQTDSISHELKRPARNDKSRPKSASVDNEEVSPATWKENDLSEVASTSTDQGLVSNQNFTARPPSPLQSVASDSGSQQSFGHQPRNPTQTHTNQILPKPIQRLPVQPSRSSQYANGYSEPNSILSSEEAAVLIQRSLRANAVRKTNVVGKLRLLNSVLDDVKQLTASERYDMEYLRGLRQRCSRREERRDGAQRLLELGEYLTQQMLKVDGVESSGSQLVRTKRKESVNMILGLTDEVDGLRKKLQR